MTEGTRDTALPDAIPLKMEVVKGRDDTVPGRLGRWMHTSLGGRFFPEDPRFEEIHVSNYANGMALECRYGGQGRIDRFYSVAEHCYHGSAFLLRSGAPPLSALCFLLHDAAEGQGLKDMPRAVKKALGAAYSSVEAKVQAIILAKHGLTEAYKHFEDVIERVDQSLVRHEKAAIMRHHQPWAHDEFPTLDGVEIQCWAPPIAKWRWCTQYDMLCTMNGITPERWEL